MKWIHVDGEVERKIILLLLITLIIIIIIIIISIARYLIGKDEHTALNKISQTYNYTNKP